MTQNIRSSVLEVIRFCQATLAGMVGINFHILSQTCKTRQKTIYFHECFHDKNSLSFSCKKSLVKRSR